MSEPGKKEDAAAGLDFSKLREQPLDLKRLIADDAEVLIGYHGGCVDGCASTHMLSTAISACHPGAKIESVALGHQTERFATAGCIRPGMTVFSLDITPSMGDVEALQRAKMVIMLDHHTSELETQKKLVEACPNIVNKCTASGMDCAASMVLDLTKGICTFDADIVSMVHKMDVFAHDLPKHLEEDFVGFRAYVTKKGERSIPMDLVEEVFKDSKKCIAEGTERAAVMLKTTEDLAAGLAVVKEEATWRVLYVFQSEEVRPVDMMHYQKLIDAKIDGKPTLVLTHDVKALPNGLHNLGLRRAGDNLNIVDVAAGFKTQPGIVGGGGHPFAGGVQSNEPFTRETIIEMAIKVMSNLALS